MKSSFVLGFMFIFSSGAEATSAPPPRGEWTIRDGDGQVCMRMSLSAQIQVLHESGNRHKTYDILPSYQASGICTTPFRQFTLAPPNSTKTRVPQLQLSFFSRSFVDYSMTHVMAIWYDPTDEDMEGDFTQGDNLLHNAVIYRHAYQCDDDLEFDLKGGYGRVFLWSSRLDPFAEDSDGQVQVCSTSKMTVIITVASVIGGALFVAVLAYVVYRRYTRRRPRAGDDENDGEKTLLLSNPPA
ncbi:uncharacterized protein LOC119723284 [Patiria miniata]|uniref:Uncharacterized protein n=1 Tax=Patiria miniata TaxID=46514 RepID=A0A913ZFD6_PATMI|nr:uncharacterized protein LOC119723284 [Patiria miniata]